MHHQGSNLQPNHRRAEGNAARRVRRTFYYVDSSMHRTFWHVQCRSKALESFPLLLVKRTAMSCGQGYAAPFVGDLHGPLDLPCRLQGDEPSEKCHTPCHSTLLQHAADSGDPLQCASAVYLYNTMWNSHRLTSSLLGLVLGCTVRRGTIDASLRYVHASTANSMGGGAKACLY